MKTYFFSVILAALAMSLTACASGTWQDSSGNPVSKADKFECDQRCGLYDSKIGPIEYGMCKSDCLPAKGYSLH